MCFKRFNDKCWIFTRSRKFSRNEQNPSHAIVRHLHYAFIYLAQKLWICNNHMNCCQKTEALWRITAWATVITAQYQWPLPLVHVQCETILILNTITQQKTIQITKKWMTSLSMQRSNFIEIPMRNIHKILVLYQSKQQRKKDTFIIKHMLSSEMLLKCNAS